MSDPLEWYAADGFNTGDPSFAPLPVMEYVDPGAIFYARVVGYPGAVVWTLIWEPLSTGDTPTSWAGGPLAAGQYPTVENEFSPDVYSPQNANARAVGGALYSLGIVRLLATAGGVTVPGELVMTLTDGGGYPDIALSYSGGAPAPEAFWTAHQNTYEIP